jgi:hypothetical protein
MIILLQELSAAIMASPGDAPSEAVDIYLKMKRDSTLANILDTEYQTRQFSVAAEDILQNYLEPKTYNCMPARVFLHQILAKVILEMIVVSCSKPEFINGWIVYLLEDGEPELMNAIDAGVEESSGQLQNVKKNIEKTTGEVMSPERKEHKRHVSRAQDAMDEAMQEAKRLSQLIADEDAKRLKSLDESTSSLNEDQSASTTQGRQRLKARRQTWASRAFPLKHRHRMHQHRHRKLSRSQRRHLRALISYWAIRHRPHFVMMMTDQFRHVRPLSPSTTVPCPFSTTVCPERRV